MKPVKFKEVNKIYAENQREYNPLPVLEVEGIAVSCWRVSFFEAVRILLTRKIWHSQQTFGQHLQPIYKTTKKREVIIPTK